MISEVKMFTVVCDNCGKDIGSEQDYSCWNDEQYAEENALNSEWIKYKGKHYCSDCYSIDDDDNILLRPVKPELHHTKS